QLGPPKLLCAPEPATTTTTASTTTTTTSPPCPGSCIAGACEVCGSCGNGECHKSGGGAGCGAPTTTPICIDTSTCVNSPCSTDADCTNPARPTCAFGGSVPGGSGCCALCP